MLSIIMCRFTFFLNSERRNKVVKYNNNIYVCVCGCVYFYFFNFYSKYSSLPFSIILVLKIKTCFRNASLNNNFAYDRFPIYILLLAFEKQLDETRSKSTVAIGTSEKYNLHRSSRMITAVT